MATANDADAMRPAPESALAPVASVARPTGEEPCMIFPVPGKEPIRLPLTTPPETVAVVMAALGITAPTTGKRTG